ncbi:MAG: hypothetical protein AAGA46_00390 [Cyanobacteria bacterium P01_F01_bin.13]
MNHEESFLAKQPTGLSLCRIRKEFRRESKIPWIYTESPDQRWLINRTIATCKYRPDAWGVVSDYPVNGYRASVWVDNFGCSRDLIGVFDYCENLSESIKKLGQYAQMAASRIWELSEDLDIPLAEHAEVIFSAMIQHKGVQIKEVASEGQK